MSSVPPWSLLEFLSHAPALPELWPWLPSVTDCDSYLLLPKLLLAMVFITAIESRLGQHSKKTGFIPVPQRDSCLAL